MFFKGKKKQEKEAIDFDLDSDLDLGGFDFDPVPEKDDRKPVTKVAAGFAEGVATGLKDTSFIKRTLKDVLPRGFGETIDLGDQVSGSVRSLYDESAKQIKPAIKDFKRVATKLIPKDAKIVPKSVADMLSRWEEESKETNNAILDKANQRESFLTNQLADIFAAQTEMAQQAAVKESSEKQLQLGLDLKQHKDIFGVLNLIQQTSARQDQFNRTVGLSFQKKTLELQYRQLFALQDLVELSGKQYAQITETLPKVVKNTALPDYLKLTSKEFLGDISKRKFVETISGSLFGKQREFMAKMIGGMKDKFTNKLMESVTDFREALLGIEQAKEMMPDEGGPDGHVLAGNVAGNVAVQGMGALGGKWAREKLAKVKPLQKAGKKAEQFVEDVPRSLMEFKNDSKYEFESGPTAWLLRNLQSLMPGATPDTEMKRTTFRNMEEPFHFTKRTDKSINEIIPGYLARILREVQISRTGDESVELTTFDYMKDKFSTESALKSSLNRNVIRDQSVERSRATLQQILDIIDPEGKMTDEAKESLQERMITNSTQLRKANSANLGNEYKYKGAGSKEASGKMTDFLTSADEETKLKFTRLHNQLSDDIADPRGTVETLMNLGYTNQLKEMGYLDKSGRLLNTESILAKHKLDFSKPSSTIPNTPNQPVSQTTTRSTASTAASQATGASASTEDNFVGPERSILNEIKQDLKQKLGQVNKVTSATLATLQEKLKNKDNVNSSLHNEEAAEISTQNTDAHSESNLGHTTSASEELKEKINSKQQNKYVRPPITVQDVKDKASSVVEEAKETADVFVEGEVKPRLSAVKLKLGKYWDKITGSPIYHHQDINGDVVDENNRTVISAEELSQLRVWYPTTQKYGPIRFLGRMAMAILRGSWNFQKNVALPWTKFNIKVLKAVGTFGLNVAKMTMGTGPFSVKDVYVGDEKNPRLYAQKLINGDYRDRLTGKVLYHQSDISGEVIDGEGQIKISEEDLPNLKVYNSILGLFNPFKLAAKVIKGIGKGIAWTGKKSIAATKYLATGMMKAFGDLVRPIIRYVSKPEDVFVRGDGKAKLYGIYMKEGRYVSAKTGKPIYLPSDIDGPIIDTLDDQIKLTEEDIEKGLVNIKGSPLKAGVIGNIKKGLSAVSKLLSYRTSLKMNISDKTTTAVLKDKNASVADKSLATLVEIKNIFKKQFGPKQKVTGDLDGDGEREGSYNQLKKRNAEAKAAKDKDKAGKTAPKPESKAAAATGGMFDGLLDKLGSMKSLITGAASLLGLGGTATALASGTAATAAAAGGAVAAETAAAGALATAGGAAASGGVLAGIGGALGAIGSGLLAFISSPVVLGVAAVAALGYGAYKTYKYFKNKLEQIDNLRLVQYGFNKDDTENYKKILELERYLKDFTVSGSKGLMIKEKELKIKDLLSPFNLDHTKKEDLELFFKWYQNRFKPVYLTQCAAILATKKELNLDAISSLKDKELSTYFELAKFEDGPYGELYLPIRQEGYKVSDSEAVKDIIKELTEKLKIVKVSKDGKPLGKLGTTSNADTDPIQPNADALTDPSKLDPKYNPNAKSNLGKTNLLDNKETMGVGQSKDATEMTSSAYLSKLKQFGNLTALEAAKFRAYGLVELEVPKVKALQATELQAIKYIKYMNGVATWSGSATDVLKVVMGQFGVFETIGNDAYAWCYWFNRRFLPIFLDYVTYYLSTTGRKDYDDNVGLLKVSQQLELAKIIGAIPDTWNITYSPFPGYKLNTDPNSIKQNVKFLEDVAKEEKFLDDRKDTLDKEAANSPKPVSQRPNDVDGNLKGKVPPSVPQATPAPADSEQSTMKSATITQTDATSNPNGLKLASGKMMDGRNGFNSINLAKGANLDRVNPALLKQFYGMVEEYNQITGKKVTVTDGYRSYEQQVAMKAKYGPRAATPGSSLHGFGLALDVDSKALNAMDELGLMRKYGFMRPVGKEPWHMEPAGIQLNIDKYKNDLEASLDAIERGAGKGGGGLGTLADAPAYSRNRDYSSKILMAKIEPNVTISDNKTSTDSLAANSDSTTSTGTGSYTAKTPSASSPSLASSENTGKSLPRGGNILKTSTSAGGGYMGSISSATDNESKPKSGTGIVKDKVASLNTGSALPNTKSGLPADPTVKVSDPKGGDVSSVKKTVEEAAKMVGTNPDVAVSTVAVESGFNPSAKAKGTSASGLYQFTNSTWNETLGKYGSRYGLTTDTSPFDAKANAIMGAHYLKDTNAQISSKTGKEVGPTESYLGHFLGAGGASSFIKAMDKDASQSAPDVMPRAAGSNKPIFYNGEQPRSLAQVYNLLDSRVKTKASSFGITLNQNPDAPKLPTIDNGVNNLASTATGAPGLFNSDKATPSTSKPITAPTMAGNDVAGGNGISLPNTRRDSAITRASFSTDPVNKPSPVKQFSDIGKTPMDDALGFNPSRIRSAAQSAAQSANSSNNFISPAALKTTEELLGKSVDLQSQMVAVLKDIFGIVSAGKPADGPKMIPVDNRTDGSPGSNYTAPKLPVNMKRSA